MTLDRAIDILRQEEQGEFKGTFQARTIAYRLGIEAMRRIKEVRRFPRTWDARALPGETEE